MEDQLTTIEAFNDAARRYLRGMLIVAAVGALVAAVGCAAAIVFRDPMKSWYVERFSAPAAEVLLGATPWLPAVIVTFAGLLIVDRRLARDPALRCPHCRKQLLGVRHLVIATRNCPYCGRRVVAEPTPA